MGFRRVCSEMPEGDLVCWTDIRGDFRGPQDQPPVVFLHGLGLGVFTYLPLFLGGEQSRAWRSGGSVIVELPCMTSSLSDLQKLPSVEHCADALGRLLRERIGCGDHGYDVVCHSLSASGRPKRRPRTPTERTSPKTQPPFRRASLSGLARVLSSSAQAYLASVLANHGSPCRPRRTVLIDPVCFMEGVEV